MNRCLIILCLLPVAAVAQQLTGPDREAIDPEGIGSGQPTASHGGSVQLEPARALDPSQDPVNELVVATTADGLVISVLIDGDRVTLESADAARVPRKLARSDREIDGDRVQATGFVSGQAVTTTVIPDTVLNASEGEGVVRTERRHVSLVLASDVPLERVEIDAPATGARAMLDVRGAYEALCRADPEGRWCPGGER